MENEDEINEMEENTDYLVTVFATDSQGTAAVVHSILDEAGIKYLVKGEGIQNLVGFGVIGMGYNPLAGLIEFQVMPDDKELALELLKDINESEVIGEANLLDEEIPENQFDSEGENQDEN